MGCCLGCKIPICPNLENCCRAINYQKKLEQETVGGGGGRKQGKVFTKKGQEKCEIIIYSKFNYAINTMMGARLPNRF